MAGCDTVIHLVGIIREHPATHATFERVHAQGTVNVLEAAAATGRPPLPAHERARHAGRRPLALPPHQVGGRRGGARPARSRGPSSGPRSSTAAAIEFVNMLAAMIRRYPVVPVIGSGHAAPAAGARRAGGRGLRAGGGARRRRAKHIYAVGGPDAVTMLRLLDLIGAALGRPRVRKIHVPLGLVPPARPAAASPARASR